MVREVQEGGRMYEITITKSFAAAHVLKDIGGKCEGLHGHNFVVEVSLTADKVSKEGLLIDFRVLKEWTDEILDELDHTYLNDYPYFKDLNPSAENLAKFIYDRIHDKAKSVNCAVSRVMVWESDNARASYSGV
jgi:6-pyruvoyltetrahydropterin/6-carboxytetrahydropterin synthase